MSPPTSASPDTSKSLVTSKLSIFACAVTVNSWEITSPVIFASPPTTKLLEILASPPTSNFLVGLATFIPTFPLA